MPIAPHLRPLYKTPSWFAAREKVKARATIDGVDRCERCGAKNGSYIVRDQTKRGYTEVTKRDADALAARGFHVVLIQCGCCHRNNVAGDDRPANLAWWCRGCHLRADSSHHRRTRQARKDRERFYGWEASA